MVLYTTRQKTSLKTFQYQEADIRRIMYDLALSNIFSEQELHFNAAKLCSNDLVSSACEGLTQ